MQKELEKIYKNHVTPREGERITGITQETIRRYIKKGYIECKTINGRYYIHVDALTEFTYFYAKGLNIYVYDMETIEERIRHVLSGFSRR